MYPPTSTGDRIPRSADEISADGIHFTTRNSPRFDKIVPRDSSEQFCKPMENNKSNREPMLNSTDSAANFLSSDVSSGTTNTGSKV